MEIRHIRSRRWFRIAAFLGAEHKVGDHGDDEAAATPATTTCEGITSMRSWCFYHIPITDFKQAKPLFVHLETRPNQALNPP
jgi:hypothetical protein